MTLYGMTVVTELIILVVLSLVLNAYWFMLMAKMIIRVIRRSLAT